MNTFNTKLSDPIDLGPVRLRAADLAAQERFYTTVLGLQVVARVPASGGVGASDSGAELHLGTDLRPGAAPLVILTHSPGARRPARRTGLYHFALVFPDRGALALALDRLDGAGWRHFPTDHIETKTTYLKDPEGQDIELYCESPEDGVMTWENGLPAARRRDGSWSDGREALDTEALRRFRPAGADPQAPWPAAVRMGHIHLYTRDEAEAARWYTQVLGFDLKGHAPQAAMAFVSVGGYHHHVGLNAWMGPGAPPPSPGSLGLDWWTLGLSAPDLAATLERLRAAGSPLEALADGSWRSADPSHNGVRLVLKSPRA